MAESALGMKAEEFYALLMSEAKAAGLAAAGAVDLDLSQDAFMPHRQRYRDWIADGKHGDMNYLLRGQERREDPRLVFPAAQSILCVAFPYANSPNGATSAKKGVQYARYIRDNDYHKVILTSLEVLMERVKAKSAESTLHWKVCVDTSAVLERSWAALAGLGWIGKNTLLIHPQLGSYFFIGSVLINHKTQQGPQLLPNYCGNCTRCLDRCPTQAFTSSGSLDSKRCVSYWTLEKRGELALSEEQKTRISNWVAGCDVCQEVCPFNQKPVKNNIAPPLTSGAEHLFSWESLLAESDEGYRVRVRNSALSRVKPHQFSRNLAITLFNAIENGDLILTPEFQLLIHQRLARARDSEDRASIVEWERCITLTRTD